MLFIFLQRSSFSNASEFLRDSPLFIFKPRGNIFLFAHVYPTIGDEPNETDFLFVGSTYYRSQPLARQSEKGRFR